MPKDEKEQEETKAWLGLTKSRRYKIYAWGALCLAVGTILFSIWHLQPWRWYTYTDDIRIKQVAKDVDPGYVLLLSWWLATPAAAAIDEVNVSMNPIGVDGAKALGAILLDSSLKCLIIGPKSTRLPVNDAEVTELNFEGQDFTPVEVTLVAVATSTMAALN